MQTLKDGTKISDRRWEELTMIMFLEDLKSSYCRPHSCEIYEIHPDYMNGAPCYIENSLNYKDIRIAEEYVITDSRVYRPEFEFIKHKDRKHTVPVFLETSDISEGHEEELLKKYRDICLSCREFVILCGYPVFIRHSAGDLPEELRDKMAVIIERLFTSIKHEKIEHETITVKLIAEDRYLDEDNIPDCEVISLRAFHTPKKPKDKITDRKIKVTVTAVLDNNLVKEGMFDPLKDNDESHKRYMKLSHAFREIKFSLSKRHHYNPRIFLSSWDYADGVLTLIYRENSFDQEPLLRYLISHPVEEVKVIRRPVFDPYFYSSIEDEYAYVPLARSKDTKITGITIEYAGNIYKIY